MGHPRSPHPPYPQRHPPAVPPGKRGPVRLRQMGMPPKKDRTCLFVSLGIGLLFLFLILGIIGGVCWYYSSKDDTKDDYERGFRAAQAAKSETAAPVTIIEREVPARSSYQPPPRAPPPRKSRSGIGSVASSFGNAMVWGAGMGLGAGLVSNLFRRRLPEKSE